MNSENLIESAKSFGREFMKKNDPSHDWLHVERVYKNALFIADQEKATSNMEVDLEIVKLAALFHDIVDFKYDHEKSMSMEDIANERLSEFFKRFNYPVNKIEKILYIVLNISWRKEIESIEKGLVQNLTNELKIVRDADRLDAIGAIGVARCFAFTGHKLRPFYCEKEMNGERSCPSLLTSDKYNEQTRKNESNALGHFNEKLFFISEKIQTETGKRLAKERHDFMRIFFDQFKSEMI